MHHDLDEPMLLVQSSKAAPLQGCLGDLEDYLLLGWRVVLLLELLHGKSFGRLSIAYEVVDLLRLVV